MAGKGGCHCKREGLGREEEKGLWVGGRDRPGLQGNPGAGEAVEDGAEGRGKNAVLSFPSCLRIELIYRGLRRVF